LADPSGQAETRGVTLAELKAGVKLFAGHQVVLVVGDLAGRKRSDEPAAKKPALDKPGTSEAPAGEGPAAGGPAGAEAGADAKKPAPIEDKFAVAQVLNAAGAPAAGVFYELTLPDGTLKTGKTDDSGNLKVDAALQSGECTLVFPDYEPKKA